MLEQSKQNENSKSSNKEFNKSHSESSEFMGASELAKYLDWQVSTVYAKTHSKLIPHFKRGKKLLFKKSEIDKWLESGRVLTETELEAVAERLSCKNKGGSHAK